MSSSTEALAGRRVALVHDWLNGMRGGERVLEAIAELVPLAPIYTLLHVPGSTSEALEAHPIKTSFLQRAPGIRRHYRHYLPLFPSAIEDLDLSCYDLIISSSHCVAKGIKPAPDALHVCYCHTPMRYAWDQEHVYFPRRRGLVARLRNLALTGLRAWDVASAPRVDRFLANSSWVAERIRRYYGRQADVLAPPVDVDYFEPPDPTTETNPPYCLAVSALAPYKRVEVAIEACRQAGVALKVVGEGPERSRLEGMAGSGVELLGRVSRQRLRQLYQGALAFVQPGLEDFGIATVEALACGTPVVALGRGGVLDIVADGQHGVLYGPADEGQEATAMAAAIDKSRQIRFNPLELHSRARDFSPARFTQQLRKFLARWIAETERPS